MIERTPDLHESKLRANDRFFVTKRLFRWSLTGLTAFAVLTTACLFLVPQSYTSRLSLSLASSTGGTNSLLASVTGMGSSPATKYVGVLRSRSFAEQVVQKVGLHRLYGLPSTEDAIDPLLDGLTVADNPRDGLLYINVSLSGPPRLARGAARQTESVRHASADAANLYADLLRQYITTADTDSDALLLNGASGQLSKARKDYDDSVARLTDFVRAHGGQTGAASLSPKETGSADAETTARELQSLYTQQATLESEILSTEAAQRMGEKLQANQLHNLASLPSEDPLLTQARASVALLRNTLDNERVLLGPENPAVVADQEKLKLAEERLQQQMLAVKQGLTTQKVDSQVKLQALRTKYQTLGRQITDAERKAHVSREMATSFEERRNEVLLRLEVLKTMSAQAAMLSMQVVSAQNRIKVVDYAHAPRTGSPGLLKFSLLCGLLTTALMALWIHLEYRAYHRSRAAYRPTLSVASSGT